MAEEMPNVPSTTTVMDRDTDTKEKTKSPRQWQVVFLNDDFTPMDFVVAMLMNIFGHSVSDATKIMMDVHAHGRGIAGIFTFEIAETKVSAVSGIAKQNEFPLRVLIEPAPKT